MHGDDERLSNSHATDMSVCCLAASEGHVCNATATQTPEPALICCSDDLRSMREEDEQSDVQQADSWQGDEGFEEEEDSDEEYDDSGFLAEPATASVAGAPQSGWSILDREKLKAMQVHSCSLWRHLWESIWCTRASKACQ